MDGIPVMSRAACRNHAVHTLGCVNQTAHEVTRGKGDHGADVVGRGVRPGKRYTGHAVATATCVETPVKSRMTRLSHTDRLDLVSTSCNLAARLLR